MNYFWIMSLRNKYLLVIAATAAMYVLGNTFVGSINGEENTGELFLGSIGNGLVLTAAVALINLVIFIPIKKVRIKKLIYGLLTLSCAMGAMFICLENHFGDEGNIKVDVFSFALMVPFTFNAWLYANAEEEEDELEEYT